MINVLINLLIDLTNIVGNRETNFTLLLRITLLLFGVGLVLRRWDFRTRSTLESVKTEE